APTTRSCQARGQATSGAEILTGAAGNDQRRKTRSCWQTRTVATVNGTWCPPAQAARQEQCLATPSIKLAIVLTRSPRPQSARVAHSVGAAGAHLRQQYSESR